MSDVKFHPKRPAEAASKPSAPRQPKAALSRTTQDRIGAQLRLAYRELIEEPVPQRFLDLIDRLDKKD